jgi:membrane protein
MKIMPKRKGTVFALRETNIARMKKRLSARQAWEVVKLTFSDFGKDKVMKMAASLAYATIFALPGLLIIIIWVTSFFYSPSDVQGRLLSQMTDLIGTKAVVQVQEVLINTKFDYTTLWAKILGIVTLVLSATGAFGEIQDSINTIWSLKTKPRAGFVKILINRLLSFSLVISLAFILIVSLVVNTLISALMDNVQAAFPGVPIVLYFILNQLVTAIVLVLLFGSIFKVLPDAKISWRDVLLSSIITTILFMGGKFLIGYILGENMTVNAYGSAGAVIIILLWVYYSSIILYLGAEFTQAYLKVKGRHIRPNRYAVWVEKKEVAVESNTEVEKETEPVKKKR